MKKVIIIVGSIVVVALVLLILHSQTYSLSDIEADNYKHKLKKDDKSIWNCMIDDCIPDNVGLWSSYMYSEIQSNGLKIEKIQTNPTRTRISISNTPSSLDYDVWFENGEIPVACQISSSHYDPLLKQIADQLILKKQFILKKSNLMSGDDILIKETDDDFIIVDLNRKYEYPDPPLSFIISTYSKRRFF